MMPIATPSPYPEQELQDPPIDDLHAGRRHENDRQGWTGSGLSPEELRHLLVNQERESRTLRQALRTAFERIDAETERAASIERVNRETIQHLRQLSESRIAAQREALKATLELRAYQSQLQTAQDEIFKAQDVLRTIERQRDEAEEEATRERTRARQLHLEKMVTAAREEGRRRGFEVGLRRAQDEYDTVPSIRHAERLRYDRPITYRVVTDPPMLVPEGVPPPQTGSGGADNDQTSDVSSPSQLPLRNLGNKSNARSRPPENRPVTNGQPVGAPPSPPPSPRPGPQPAEGTSQSSIPRADTPSITVYSLPIPPPEEVNYDSHGYPGQQPQQWVTATEHEVLTRDQSPSTQAQSDLRRSMSDVQQPPSAQLQKRKEPWYRTIGRALTRRRKSAPNPTIAGPPYQNSSWYAAKPPAIVRDFAVPQPKSSTDSASVSTRMSQLGIVNAPNGTSQNVASDTPPGDVAARLARKYGDRAPDLYVINEDPASRESTPYRNRGHERSRSVDAVGTPILNASRPSLANDNRTSKHQPDDGRSSMASSKPPRSTIPLPPTHRPAKLTVPAPLAGAQSTDREAFGRGQPGGGSFSPHSNHGRRPSLQPSDRQHTSSDRSQIGINVEPPSQSTTETPGTDASGREYGLLSPNSQVQSPLPEPVAPSPRYPISPSYSPRTIPQETGTHQANGSTYSPQPGYQQATPSRPTSAAGSVRQPTQPVFNDPFRSASNTSRPPSTKIPSGAGGPHARVESIASAASSQRPLSPAMTPKNNGSALPEGYASGTAPGRDAQQTIHRVASDVSLRSMGSFAKYDPSTYLDPAFFPPNLGAAPQPTVARPTSAAGGSVAGAGASASPVMSRRSRAASTSSSMYTERR